MSSGNRSSARQWSLVLGTRGESRQTADLHDAGPDLNRGKQVMEQFKKAQQPKASWPSPFLEMHLLPLPVNVALRV